MQKTLRSLRLCGSKFIVRCWPHLLSQSYNHLGRKIRSLGKCRSVMLSSLCLRNIFVVIYGDTIVSNQG